MFCHFSARSRRSGTAWMHSYLGQTVSVRWSHSHIVLSTSRIQTETIKTVENRWNHWSHWNHWKSLISGFWTFLNNLVSKSKSQWKRYWRMGSLCEKKLTKRQHLWHLCLMYSYVLCLCSWCSHCCHCSHWAHGHRLTKALGTSLGDPCEFSKRIEISKFVKYDVCRCIFVYIYNWCIQYITCIYI
jgi:hypothetical protein